MTDLRQAAQQALVALIDAANVLSAPMFADAVAALKAALEQQAETVVQRPWQGLTDEEIEIIYAECNVWDKFEYERMLEAKLKDKNT